MPETLGRYQLLKKLAIGGMGQVYLARQRGPVGFEKLVVVKSILPHLAEEDEFIQMFFDEARIAAVLTHPNIAQIYELGEAAGTYFIAMEHVNGVSLRALNALANDRGLGVPLGLKCRVIADAAGALDFAHRAKAPGGEPLGIIHRDVSPQNILVGFNGGVKLIDFGVAKARGKISTTMTGAIKGKYAYMSPEQARGEELDARSDVFGLGIVLYEVLTSSRLFKRENETATLKAVVTSKVVSPSVLVKGIPKALDAIVLRALTRKRSERFQTAAELQLALEDFIARQRLPGTSAHLAAFLRELYPDEVSSEKLASEPTEVGEAVLSDTRKRPDRTPPSQSGSRKRLSFDELADRATGARRPAVAARGPGTSELNERLAAVAVTDSVRGMFFNAVLGEVGRVAGAPAEAAVRAAATDPRPYVEAFAYPTSEFLRVLWRAAELALPDAAGTERAFYSLGGACFEAVLRSAAGRGLEAAAEDTAPERILAPLLGAIRPLCTPGDRRVESATAQGAVLVYESEPLPGGFHAGFVARACSRLGEVEAQVTWEKAGPRTLRLTAQW